MCFEDLWMLTCMLQMYQDTGISHNAAGSRLRSINIENGNVEALVCRDRVVGE